MSESLCKGMNADFWFPPMEEANQSPYYRIGKSLCHHCPVWQECLQYAQTNGEVWGCWGGITPQERKRPHKISHGTIEKKRLGCTCSACAAAGPVTSPPPIGLIPRMGEEYDIQNLIFALSTC